MVRVQVGELFQFAEFPPTIELTKNAESESSRRFCFYAYLARTCDDLSVGESSLRVARERHPVRFVAKFAAKLSRSRFNRGLWVSNLVGFGVAKRTGFGRPNFRRSCRRSATRRLPLCHQLGHINAGRNCSRWIRPPAIARSVNLRRVVQPK